jgi:SAM-dependent methyltransferase
MELSSEQRKVLGRLRHLLVDAAMDKMPAALGTGEASFDASLVPEPLQTILRLFCSGEALEDARVASHAPPDLISILEAYGLLRRNGDLIAAGGFRLVDHMGLFLFCETVSSSARFYYGQDSLVLSRQLFPAEGRVLDLCAGVGAQALVCAQTATSVTAVEIEPLAEGVFWINAALNGLSHRVEYLVGDLLEPIAGRRFDLVCCNPPFMPVPPGVRFPRFADGGADGLAVVRRLLAGLPEVLAPDGRCHVVGAVLGNSEGPEPACFERLAAEANLAITVSCLYSEELDLAMLASCTGTAVAGDGCQDASEVFRDHFAGLGATRLYYFLLTAALAARLSVYFAYDDVQRVSVGPV